MADEEALILYLKLSDEQLGELDDREAAYQLEDALRQVIEESRVGEYDGHEVGAGYARLFMYGPSADRLAERALPIVLRHHPRPGSFGVKRYGPPGSREERLPF